MVTGTRDRQRMALTDQLADKKERENARQDAGRQGVGEGWIGGQMERKKRGQGGGGTRWEIVS